MGRMERIPDERTSKIGEATQRQTEKEINGLHARGLEQNGKDSGTGGE